MERKQKLFGIKCKCYKSILAFCRWQKGILKIVIRILAIAVLLLGVIAIFTNSLPREYRYFKNYDFAEQLCSCPMPKNTKIAHTMSVTGNYVENNICFAAILMVESELPEDELHDYFSTKNFSDAKLDKEQSNAFLEIKKASGYEFKSIYCPEKTFHFLPSRFDNLEKMYYVMIYDQVPVTNFWLELMY